jgi:hypothetical protein
MEVVRQNIKLLVWRRTTFNQSSSCSLGWTCEGLIASNAARHTVTCLHKTAECSKYLILVLEDLVRLVLWWVALLCHECESNSSDRDKVTGGRLVVIACCGVGEVSACRLSPLEPHLAVKHIMFYDWTRGHNVVFYQPVPTTLSRHYSLL